MTQHDAPNAGNYAAQRIQEEIRGRLRRALAACAPAGLRDQLLGADIALEVPRQKEHGDFATNLAMATARLVGTNPRAWASTIVEQVDTTGSDIERVEVAGPGFINIHLNPRWLHGVIADVFARGQAYGDVNVGSGRRVLIEFVSANPTGPLNMVNARHAALGDALANLLQAAGYRPAREYYVNDSGNQFRMLGLAMETRVRQLLGQDAELPEGAYPGEYVIDVAREFLGRHGSGVLDLPDQERRDQLARFAVARFVADHRAVLADFGVEFDRWYHESEVRSAQGPEQVVAQLTDRGHTYEHEGALWFRSTEFGDDKDRVLVKTDGDFTYIVPDTAYHQTKFERGFDVLIDLLGQDHHGFHVRMAAALSALGHDPSRLEVIYLQMVHLVRSGERVRMSKRRGEYVTMRELLDEVSVDAARYFFLMRSADTTMDFDLDLAQLQGQENPVYYVQYAHARIAGILRQAREHGLDVPEAGAEAAGALPPGADLSPLDDESEYELLRRIAALPAEVAAAAAAREPHRLTHYAHELAAAFHPFYVRRRVIGEAPHVAQARLMLVRATQIALQKVLSIIGVTAPDRM